MALSFLETKEKIPSEIAALILQSINEAYIDYYSNISEHARGVCCATTKANFINDHMVFRARQKLADNPDVQFIKKYGRTRLIICGIYELKFKKLDSDRRPCNIMTQSVIDFNQQIPGLPFQMEFPGVLNTVTNLIAGYQQNKARTGIEAVYIVCPEGKKNKWEWKLDFYKEPISLPTPEQQARKIVKPKRGVVKDEEVVTKQRIL